MPLPPAASSESLAHRTAVIGSVVLLLVLLGLVAWQALPALLLIFGSILVSLLLGGLAAWVARRTRLGYGLALFLSGLGIVAVLVAAGWFIGSGLATQVAGVGKAFPEGVEQAEQLVRTAARRIGVDTDTVPPVAEAMPDPAEVAQRALRMVGNVVGVLGSLLLMILLGVFLAAHPATYRQGVLHLVPHARRARIGDVLDAVARAVRQWLAARLIAMVLTFFVAWGGLTLIGAPFAGGLAVLSSLVVFIPYIGPYISGSVAVLVALLDGPQTALYVGLFYIAMENIQGLTIEPLIEARLTSAPPGLLVASQIVFGVLLGPVGIILASPLVIALTVAVQMLYVKDLLDDQYVEVLAKDSKA